MPNLRLPLRDIRVNQYFGQDFQWINNQGKMIWFYKDGYGFKGHPGIDFECKIGCKVYACHDGVILYADYDDTNGNMVQIWNKEGNFKTLYGHNSKLLVKQGDKIKAGEVISLSGDTGAGTGPHLHLGFKFTKEGGNGIDNNNGYNGASDPAPFFNSAYNGFVIGNKDWDKSRCYQRYYRDAKRNLGNEMKTALYMSTKLKRMPTNEEINMAIWGGWDIQNILNPAMYPITSQLKKYGEYDKGFIPFLDK